MQRILVGIAFSVALAASCKQREYNESQTESAAGDVKAPPFNAYQLWRDGGTRADGSAVKPITDYPKNYGDSTGQVSETKADGVFYDIYERYYTGDFFSATTTPGAKFEDGTLIYPSKEGRELKLKFNFGMAGTPYTHQEAIKHCKSKGGRLPILQEIMDFCAVGSEKEQRRRGYYSKDARCPGQNYWSATVSASELGQAFSFNGFVLKTSRVPGDYFNSNHVICVVAP